MQEISPKKSQRVSFETDGPIHPPCSIPFQDAEVQPSTENEMFLKDQRVQSFVKEQMDQLKNTVLEKRNTLNMHPTHNSSLRSMISGSAHKSKNIDYNLKNIEFLAGGAGVGSFADLSVTENDLSTRFFDFDPKEMDSDKNSSFHREDEESLDEFPISFHLEKRVELEEKNAKMNIEIMPGIYTQLRGYQETWQAIKNGCTTKTLCSDCKAELHVIDDAEHVVCQDCWKITPVDQSIGDIPLEFDGEASGFGFGLGIKMEVVERWLQEADNRN